MKAIGARVRNASGDEIGLGLIEIVVSLFLLALLAVSFFPILAQGMKTSVLNANIATAGQLVSQQLDIVRTMAGDCNTVRAFDDVTVAEVADSRGNHFQPYRQVGDCPAAYPGVVRVSAWVTKVGETHRLAQAVTLVYVTSASAPTP
jgi:type II secretory pathway pseudopilin PulG